MGDKHVCTASIHYVRATQTAVPDLEARGRVTNARGGQSAGRLVPDGETGPKPCFVRKMRELAKMIVRRRQTPEKGGVRVPIRARCNYSPRSHRWHDRISRRS